MLLDDSLQAAPVDVLHDQEVVVAFLPVVEGPDKVGVVEGAAGPCLTIEPSKRRWVFRLGQRQDFERDLTAHGNVLTQENTTVAARADPLQDLVFAECEAAMLSLQ